MNTLDYLERRFGRFAIPGLIRYIVVLNALVYLLYLWNPAFVSLLTLEPTAIARGEVWRLVTYIFIPTYGSLFGALFGPTGSALDIILSLWFLWWIGSALEEVWGAFRLNVFYLIGMIGTTLAALVFGAPFANGMLNLSLFFAFAWFFPEAQMLLIILPVKVKWMAWFFAVMVFWQLLALGSLAYAMAVAAALANFLLFFGRDLLAWMRQQRNAGPRAALRQAPIPEEEAEPLHRCVICKRTDRSNPELEFRVATDGNDYCMEHLDRAHR